MRKFGQFLLCIVPLIMMEMVQVVVATIVILVSTFKIIFSGREIMTEDIMDLLQGDSIVSIVIFAQIITFVIALLVYIFGLKNKKMSSFSDSFSRYTVPILLLIFVGTEMLSGCYLSAMSLAFPKLMQDYAEMLEESGLVDMTVLSTLATLILAPLSEELVFRGITFSFARNFTSKFWIANFIQAILFGIAHGNFVQGSYAFALGLVLGYMYKKYNNILVPMIGHLIFNFGGTYLVGIIFGNSDETEILRTFIILLVGAAMVYAGFYLVNNKDSVVPLATDKFNDRYKLCYAEANRPAPQYVRAPQQMPPYVQGGPAYGYVPPVNTMGPAGNQGFTGNYNPNYYNPNGNPNMVNSMTAAPVDNRPDNSTFEKENAPASSEIESQP